MNLSVAAKDSRSTVTATVGFLCIGLQAWMISMTNAGWFGAMPAAGYTLMMPLAIIMGIMGILAYLNERALDSVIFLAVTAIGWGYHDRVIGALAGAAPQPHYQACVNFLWAVFFFYVWLGSFRADRLRMLFLLAAWLSFLVPALALWVSSHVLLVIGGYVGFTMAILSGLISAKAIMDRGTTEATVQAV